jgi:short-subunit dehydrogenase
LPGTVRAYSLDVTDVPALAAAAGDFIERFGPPELVIANAGVSVGTRGEDLADVATLRRILDVNVAGLAATLAAAITWLESLRAELHGSGVHVVCVCPGYIDTPMTRVNRYRMPFLLPADEAARRIARALAARRRLAVIPWQMAAVSLLLRAMPDGLYERLAARAPRKPRDIQV